MNLLDKKVSSGTAPAPPLVYLLHEWLKRVEPDVSPHHVRIQVEVVGVQVVLHNVLVDPGVARVDIAVCIVLV